MSVIEFKQREEGHVAFSKWDIFYGLEKAIPEAGGQDTEASPEGTTILPTTSEIEGVEPCPATTHGTDNTILASPGCTPNDGAPLAKPTTSSVETNLPASAEVLPIDEVMVPATEIDTDAPRDLMNPWAASPAMAENWIIPTTGLGGKLVSPTPSDQVRGEKPCILTVTTSIGRLNLEATGVTPSNTVIALVGRMTFQNPCMAVTFLGLSKEEREGSHQSATADKLAERDLAGD